MRPLRHYLVSAAAMLIACGLALPASFAHAVSGQTGGGSAGGTPDLVPVAVWTAVTVLLALLATSLGYLYRSRLGLDHPLHAPPIGMDDVHAHGTEDPLEVTAGHAVTPHEVVAHGGTGAADVIEQAAVAHDSGH